MIEANGLRFHVVDEGHGDPVVLLHGFPDTSHLWRGQIPALVRAGRRVIAPDLRGRGLSQRPVARDDYALVRVVEDVIGTTGASSIKDMGAVMKQCMARFAGKLVDGKKVNAQVKAKLEKN